LQQGLQQAEVITLKRALSRGRTKARMNMANTTTITGNLTREPEIRYTREGQATAQLGVAVNRRWQDRTTQEWQESTSYFDVICWRDLAENVALSLTKGMRVVVTGRLEHRTWETEEGEHRSKVEITADEVGASLRFATVDVHKVERRGAASPEGGGDSEGAEALAADA
jgi:single-strand DNA-binding protein